MAYRILVIDDETAIREAIRMTLEYEGYKVEEARSGEDGLDATRQILAQAKAHLNPGGLLVVEIGHNRDALEASYPSLPFTWLDTESGDQFVFMLRREDLAGL